jgi:DNA-binding IclR family transcriptional regulator
VSRIYDILGLLSRHPDANFGVSEIARRLALNKATTHSLLVSMTEVGFLQRHSDLKYSLGRELVALGQVALSRHRAIELACKELTALERSTGLNCAVSICSHDQILVVAISPWAVVAAGAATPLVPPFGILFLAWADETAIEAWLARAENLSPSAKASLMRELENVRKLGFQMSLPIDWRGLLNELAKIDGRRDDRRLARAIRKVIGNVGQDAGYTVAALRSREKVLPELITAPVFDAEGRVALAITLTGFTRALPMAKINAIARQLRASCSHVTRSSGGRPPPALA